MEILENNVQSLEEITQEETYSKQAILNSKKYIKQKDLVNALLDKDKKYTLKEVDNTIKKYLKGVIK